MRDVMQIAPCADASRQSIDQMLVERKELVF